MLYIYASRLISRQKGEDFEHSDYDDLKKIYSIWICINPNNKEADTINLYSFSETSLKGDLHIKDDYKFINIIMLNVGKDYDYKEKNNDILKMLSLLFKDNGLMPVEVPEILEKDYDIILSKEEVSRMINLSQSFIDEWIQQGIQINQKDTAMLFVNMIKSGLPASQIFKASKASKEIIDLVNEILNADNKD